MSTTQISGQMTICGLALSKACVRLSRKDLLPQPDPFHVRLEKGTARMAHVTKNASADYETGSFTCHDVFLSLGSVTG